MPSISGTVTIAGDPDDWIAVACNASTHAYAGVAAIVDGEFEITGLTAGTAYIVTCRPKSGPAWAASRTTAANDYTVPADPVETPYLFKAGLEANYGSVSLLLPMNGADGSTTFTDYSGTPKTVTPSGNAHIETDQSKYYGASGYFDGAGDYLSIADNASMELGSGEFTLECWLRLTGYSSGYVGSYRVVLVGKDVSTGRAFHWGLMGTASSYTQLYWSTAGTELAVNWSPSLNTWYHVAVCKSGTTLRFFVDGSQVGSNQIHNTSIPDVAAAWMIAAMGYANYEYYLPGYLQDVRITKGVARYTAGFTPPGILLPSTGTVEPTWDTTPGNTTAENGIIWTNMGRMLRSLSHGPLIAA